MEWNGFSKDKIYDSTWFVNEELSVEISNKQVIVQKKIEAKYKQVKWVDVKINNQTKKIEANLRINLKEKENNTSLTFDDLLVFAKNGVKKYWERNSNRIVGTSIQIHKDYYEFFINPINTKEKSMPTIGVYSLNSDYGRSRNWWASRKLYYNEGESFHIYLEISKYYPAEYHPISKEEGTIEDKKEFEYTATHEIGHEILQAYGGKYEHSYIHKGSSTLFTQKVKPNSHLPSSGEIDLMKYYKDEYLVLRDKNNFYARVVAEEKDVIGLAWLTKLQF
ncbi:hypothetical protein ETU09_06195 [Apibacter muscae]|uniref:Uncharacterized protein n=1 Tax=Apibacter muscae TaxID=2509004 RepID=A0A563DDQ8_9FLAO|nr:hypothetical protein [Apibacter muscae]TWP28326.1 hypothetical protein ETU09_06195 [Apibacter muscae]